MRSEPPSPTTLERNAELAAAYFTSGPETERERTAFVLLSLMSGALQLSRAVADPALSETILATARQSALEMVKDFYQMTPLNRPKTARSVERVTAVSD